MWILSWSVVWAWYLIANYTGFSFYPLRISGPLPFCDMGEITRLTLNCGAFFRFLEFFGRINSSILTPLHIFFESPLWDTALTTGTLTLYLLQLHRVTLAAYTCIYIITQVILAFWLALAYDLLEDRCTIDIITTKFFHPRFEKLDNILHDWAKYKYKKAFSRHWTATRSSV